MLFAGARIGTFATVTFTEDCIYWKTFPMVNILIAFGVKQVHLRP